MRYINHIKRQAPFAGILGKHKTDFMCFCLSVWFCGPCVLFLPFSPFVGGLLHLCFDFYFVEFSSFLFLKERQTLYS